MLVCVLRRPAGSSKEQFDLHAFVCDAPEHAMAFTDNLQMLYNGLVVY